MSDPTTSLISEIQREALSSNVSTSSILRKAKVAAVKLDSNEALEWIEHELNGYSGIPMNDLPPYRKIHGELRALNPYQGWIPVHINYNNTEIENAMTFCPIAQSIASIEGTLNSDTGSSMTIPLDSTRRQILLSTADAQFDVVLRISRGQVEGILDSVVNLVLDWSLALEKKGIIGEGMTFSKDEKHKASSVTTHVFAQNIGTLGDVSGSPNISNNQTALEIPLDKSAVKSLLNQISSLLDQLPQDLKNEAQTEINSIDVEDDPEEKTRSKLQSLRTICEAASGNIVAHGIVSAITDAL